MAKKKIGNKKTNPVGSDLEKLRDGLYKAGSDGIRIRERSYLHPNRIQSKESWEPPQENHSMKKKKPKPLSRFSLGQKIFLLSFLVFLFSAGFAFMTFYQSRNTISSRNIAVEFDHVAFVDGGEELAVAIDVTNNNFAPLSEVQVALEYPSVTANNDSGIAREVMVLDSLRSGETKTAEFGVVMYGQQGAQKNLRAALQYRVEGSSATFEKDSTSVVTLRSTPVDIVLDSRTQILNGQDETYVFSVISQSDEPLENLVFQLDTPPGFTITDSSPVSLLGADIWPIGTLDPLEETKITVTGSVAGESGQSKTFRAYVGSRSSLSSTQIGTVYNTLSHTVDLVQPFLRADIFVERSTEEVVSLAAGRTISGSIQWENTLDEAVKNPEIILYMNGSAFNASAAEGQSGFYDSSQGRIVWSKETIESLRVIEPGQSGTLRFSLTPKEVNSAYAQPEVGLRVAIKGIDGAGQIREANQADVMRVQLGTVLDVLAESLHYDGPFTNSGPLPPRVGRSTEYTVRWTVTNSANPVERARVVATLPPYVEWGGETSPAGENIRYEPTSRSVIWDVGDIAVSSGRFGSSGRRSVDFQVVATPSNSQIDEAVDLTSRVTVTGTDTFTQQSLSSQVRSATTRLLNDSGASGSAANGRVVE